MTMISQTEPVLILNFIEQQTVEKQHELIVQYFSEVPSFRNFLSLYFSSIKDKFNNEELGDVSYVMPSANAPAYSSISMNMIRLKELIAPKTAIWNKRKLKMILCSSISVEEVMFLENVLDSNLEEYYNGIDWAFLKSILKVE